MKKMILSIVLVVLLVAGGITLGVVKDKQAKTPTSTVEMDLNPSASFVVNSNNLVLSASFSNQDADIIFSDIEVVGRNIEEVAKDFTERAIKFTSDAKSYISIDASFNPGEGSEENCIHITVSGDAKQAEALRNALVNKVNAVFDENGVFGRAVGAIRTSAEDLINKYKDVAEDMQIDVSELAGKTEAEILAMINEQGKKLEGLTSDALGKVKEFVEGDVIANLESAIDSLEQLIQKLETQIDGWLELYGNDLPETIKTQIQTAKNTISQYKEQIKAKRNEIVQKIAEKITELKEQARTEFESLKTKLNAGIEARKAELEAHIQNFEANKEARLAEIKAWRDSFNTSAE